jgi:hypothetical protein
MKMLFIGLEDRLYKHALLAEKVHRGDRDPSVYKNMDLHSLASDVLQASWLIGDLNRVAIQGWNVGEEEYLKDEVTRYWRSGTHIEDVAIKVSEVLRKPYLHVMIKIINFGYWGVLYDNPASSWFEKKGDCSFESDDIPF